VCLTGVDDPHYSNGAGGVIAKAHVGCAGGPDYVGIDAYLFLCAVSPPEPKTEYWLENNCTVKGNTADILDHPADNVDYVRYVPPSDQPGAHGSGYWTACNTISVYENGTLVQSTTGFSNTVPLSVK
jgi:hypothetical protein